MAIRFHFFVFVALTLLSPFCYAQTVTIDYSTQRYLGPVSELDRSKYFVLHGIDSDADLTAFYDQYNVKKGRYFWGPYNYAKSQTGAIGTYPAFKDGSTGIRQIQPGLVATEHPANVLRYNTDLNAAAAWAVEYFTDVVSDNGRPEFFEPMNEPFVHASDDVFKQQQPDTNLMLQKMADLFGEVGKQFDQTPELANMKVIGYSSAWPSLERWDFGHWDRYQKMFMDRAGPHMDAFATHLYDGINVTGQDSFRSGSNSEAILDMIEAYSYIKWGVVKPHAITEYGGIEKGYGDNYSDLANAQAIRSINHLIFNFLERENDLLISIPFITDKSNWHLTPSNNYQPYGAVLLRPTNVGQPNPQGWVYTPRVFFFDLWKEFRGKRVEFNSDNPDIQAQAFADGNKLFVALNNIDSVAHTVKLEFVDGLADVQNVRIKTLQVYNNSLPVFTNAVTTTAPSSLSLIGGETVTLEYTLLNDISFDNAVRSAKYYADDYLQPIISGATQTYHYDGVNTGNGSASLRMSIGRKHDRSKSPIVRVNGTQVPVPNNWTGYDQATRQDFFGTIEIPFDTSLLSTINEVTVEFPDNGGHVASMILQVETYDSGPITNPPPVNPQQPYSGVAASIPGRIESETFDLGGQGIAYNDLDVINNGPNVLRESEGVDLEARDGGVSIGWAQDGEWLEYTVNTTPGTYDMVLRFATQSTGKAVLVTLDGSTLGTFELPNTGDWGAFESITIPNITMGGGDNQILRLAFIGGSANVNWLQFTSTSQASDTVSCAFMPSSLTQSASFDFSVDYSASAARDVVVVLWDGDTYLTQGRATVARGSGKADIQLNLGQALTIGNNYFLKAAIRPVGATWKSNFDDCSQSNMEVPSCDVSWASPKQSINQATLNWASEPIDIGCASGVSISMDVEGLTAANMEASDYLNIYYAVDGGNKIAISENTDGFPLKSISANNINGDRLVLYIDGKNSWHTETYNITNILVEGM